MLPTPESFGFTFDDYDGVYRDDEEGWLHGQNTQADAAAKRLRRSLENALATARPSALHLMFRVRSNIVAWAQAYKERHPITSRHDRNCVKHDVCRVLTAYRQEAGAFHALALTPPHERVE